MDTWKEQLKNSITSVSQLHKYIPENQSENYDLQKEIRISPYMMNLIANLDSESALKKQFIPFKKKSTYKYDNDYLNESKFEPIPNLIHRYKNRVIIIVTNKCACYCQFCTRQRVTKNKQNIHLEAEKILDYIRRDANINDVLITGGDPLILENTQLVSLIDQLENIDHLKVIRIGTRMPITLPMRIDNELIEALRKYNNLYINIHVNHPIELTSESKYAIYCLTSAGIPVGSQTVLLKGINDNFETLKQLFEELIHIRVKPYYLYQCDKVAGCEDFVVDPQKGISIINALSQEISGFALPKYVIDTPQLGKMILGPCHLQSLNKDGVLMKAGDIKVNYSIKEHMN